MASTNRSVKEAREFYEMKEKAAQFYAENGVPERMEEILNSMFYESPTDVFGHLATYFEGHAKTPLITKIKARAAIDSKVQPTIQTDVYCKVKNKEQCVSTSLSSTPSPTVSELARQEDRDEEDRDREVNVKAAIKLLNSDISNRLQGLNPADQSEADAVVSKLVIDLKAEQDVRFAKEAEERRLNPEVEGEEQGKKSAASSAVSKPKSPRTGPLLTLPEEAELPLAPEKTVGVAPEKGAAPEKTGGKGKSNSRAVSRGDTGTHRDRVSSRAGSSLTMVQGASVAQAWGKGGKHSAVVITTPAEPKEKLLTGSPCVSAISQALCTTGALVSNLELYEHVANLRFGQKPEKFCVPQPMVTILQSGRAAPGKSNCVKEFMIVPKPDTSIKQALPQIMAVYNNVVKIIMNKNGVITSTAKRGEKVAARNVTDLGALMFPLDRPEQGLDMIQEAITQAGLTPGEDMFLALNIAASEFFDYEKGKYDIITGQLKVPDDLVDFWCDLLGRYPSVVAMIDPIRRQDSRQWMSLCERVSERCYMMGRQVYKRPGLLKTEELVEHFKSSAVVFRMEEMNTVSDIITCCKKMEDAGNLVVLSSNVGETTDTFLADMAVGLNARFLKLGAPCRGERVAKLNRLLTIEEHLMEQNKLSQQPEFSFPLIVPPPPESPKEGEGDGESEDQTPRKDAAKKK